MITKSFVAAGAMTILIIGGFFVMRAMWGFFEQGERETFREAAKVQWEFIPLTHWGERDTKTRKDSSEDLIVRSGIRIFEDIELVQTGDIIVEGSGKLHFRNSVVKMSPSGKKKHAQIFVREKGELTFERSTLKPAHNDPSKLLVRVEGDGRFVFHDSQGVHMVTAYDAATVEMRNATWAFSLPAVKAGGIEVQDSAQVNIENSTIGGLTLKFPAEAMVSIQDFQAGLLDHFNFREDFHARNVPFHVVLTNTRILEDSVEGNSERGLSIFAPTDIASLQISNSVLHRIVFESEDAKVTFRGLELDAPYTFSSGNVSFSNSKVMAQWGFFLRGGVGEFEDSRGLRLALADDAVVRLARSELNQLDFQDYTGTVDFDNVLWENGGAIRKSEFTWSGSWIAQGFDERDSDNFLWEDSRVTRKMSIDIAGIGPEPGLLSGVKIGTPAKVATSTDTFGRAYFAATFDDTNFQDEFFVTVSKEGREQQHPIRFLTPTPIKLLLK